MSHERIFSNPIKEQPRNLWRREEIDKLREARGEEAEKLRRILVTISEVAENYVGASGQKE